MQSAKRTFPDQKTYSMEFAGRPLTMEVGKLAELCNASVLVKYGETTVLVTATASARPKDGIDYFPLAVDFEEKLYAVGRIPGSFMRREGRPSERAMLASRMIDRPMRPLFPEDLRNDVVIVCTVLSVDHDCNPEIAAMVGASAAVCISDIPFNGPIASVGLGYDGEKFLLNPTTAERETSQMYVTVAGNQDKIVMIEAAANEISDEVMLDGIKFAHKEIQKVIALIDQMVTEVGKEKFSYDQASFNNELFDKINAEFYGGFEHALDTDDKKVREERINALYADIAEKLEADFPDFPTYWDEINYRIQKKVVQAWLLQGKRVDGRSMDQIRALGAEVALIPRVHGSGLFSRGQTQALSIATLNTIAASQKLDTIYEEESKRFMHHYNFPAYSVGEARPGRSTSRREVGHGALVEKALEPVIPPIEEFPYAIRVVSEILSSNGSTSQASVCGSTLALMDAGVPIKAPVAGISCGLITDENDPNNWTTFIDIQGVEDFHGEMDFKVAGTKAGITAIQMDLKNDGLTYEVIESALTQTREARFHILDEAMLPCIAEPRAELAPTAPKMIQMKIDVEKIREVIGSGGKVIQKIVAETGAKVDIEDDGNIYISGVDIEACRAAKAWIDNIVFVPEVGKLYFGKVVRILPIGAFVELVPGKDGMVHISKLENHRVEKVEDVLKEGDMTWVKVTEIDDRGRVNLSRKDAIKEREKMGLID
ncbi:MAG: polyribonucleotide nucleotidyltransferase [Oscillospiraceae bacterium]|nr:polyribonucleotide nucleotidyltransferase [Oscillospiraceae bacterium]